MVGGVQKMNWACGWLSDSHLLGDLGGPIYTDINKYKFNWPFFALWCSRLCHPSQSLLVLMGSMKIDQLEGSQARW